MVGSVTPRVLVYTDVDDTLIDWQKYNLGKDEEKLARTQDTFTAHAEEIVLVPSTSRGISEMQRLADDMRGFPIEMLGLNNGQRLFVNERGLPGDQFVRELGPHHEDPEWKVMVREQYHWDLEAVTGAIGELVAEAGYSEIARFEPPLETLVNFQKTVGDELVTVSYYPDQASFAIRNGRGGVPGPVHKAAGDELMNRLLERLEPQGIELTHKSFLYQDEQYLYLLEPAGLDKAQLLEHLTTRFPQVTHIVTAGDADNDTMLYPDRYNGRDNHRIISGDRRSLVERLEGQPRVIQVDEGELGPGLEFYLVGTAAAVP